MATRHARSIVQGRQRQTNSREFRRSQRSGSFTLASGTMAKVKVDLRRGLAELPHGGWDAEEAELLSHDLAGIEDLIRLWRAAVTGSSGVNWDAEMARLGGDSR